MGENMKRIIVVAVISVFATLSCGKAGNPSGHTGWNNGNWIGETATSLPVAFTLNHPVITNWTVTVSHSYADTTDIRTILCSTLNVTDDSTFSWSDSVDHDSLKYSFSFSGKFYSGDSLTGQWNSTVYYDFGGGGGVDELGGSWTAGGPE
jgi:hypothetical protein